MFSYFHSTDVTWEDQITLSISSFLYDTLHFLTFNLHILLTKNSPTAVAQISMVSNLCPRRHTQNLWLIEPEVLSKPLPGRPSRFISDFLFKSWPGSTHSQKCCHQTQHLTQGNSCRDCYGMECTAGQSCYSVLLKSVQGWWWDAKGCYPLQSVACPGVIPDCSHRVGLRSSKENRFLLPGAYRCILLKAV